MLARICIGSAIASVLLIVAMVVNDRGSTQKSQALQHVRDPRIAREVVSHYPANAMDRVYRGIGLDYLFLIAYGAFLATACLLTARTWSIGAVMAAVAIVIAALDAIEGIGMLQQLRGNFAWTAATWWMSRTKYALFAIVGLYLVVALILRKRG